MVEDSRIASSSRAGAPGSRPCGCSSTARTSWSRNGRSRSRAPERREGPFDDAPFHGTTVDFAATPANAWPSILELGRLAPTPHNTQWYFVRVIDSQTARVCIDESIAIPFTDPNDQFRYMGLGVFARHLELAASAAGFELQTTFDELDGTGPVVARIVGRRAPDGALAARLRTRQDQSVRLRRRARQRRRDQRRAGGRRPPHIVDDHDGPPDRDGGVGAQQRDAARRPRGRGHEPRARPLDPVHEAVPPALPQRLHAGVAGDAGVEDLARLPTEVAAAIRCCSSMAHDAVSRHRTAPRAWGGSMGRSQRVATSSRRAGS